MTIRRESIDSKLLRWTGFAVAAFIISALTLGGGRVVSLPNPASATVTQGQVDVTTAPAKRG